LRFFEYQIMRFSIFISALGTTLVIATAKPQTTGPAPQITEAPHPERVFELLKRQNGQVGLPTCGFINGNASKLFRLD
jgi:hypothetical protein